MFYHIQNVLEDLISLYCYYYDKYVNTEMIVLEDLISLYCYYSTYKRKRDIDYENVGYGIVVTNRPVNEEIKGYAERNCTSQLKVGTDF